MINPPPQRIAVLGGGVAALVAAFELTEQPGAAERFDITVYQDGWRLGGKGASGRNADEHQRIEEHGLHVWSGFYENAFRVMQSVYGALGRPDGAPLAKWTDAFHPHDTTAFMETLAGQPSAWVVNAPRGPGTPGDGSLVVPPMEMLLLTLP